MTRNVELLARLRRGDAAAFGEMVRRFQGAVFAGQLEGDSSVYVLVRYAL